MPALANGSAAMANQQVAQASHPAAFQTYCESTSLHGWQYLYRALGPKWRLTWAVMVLSSVVVACCFVFKQASEFTKATVVTTVDTTTAPLGEVYFPSVRKSSTIKNFRR